MWIWFQTFYRLIGWNFRSQRWDVTVKTDVNKMDAEDSMVAMVGSRCINSISWLFKHQQNLKVKKSFHNFHLMISCKLRLLLRTSYILLRTKDSLKLKKREKTNFHHGKCEIWIDFNFFLQKWWNEIHIIQCHLLHLHSVLVEPRSNMCIVAVWCSHHSARPQLLKTQNLCTLGRCCKEACRLEQVSMLQQWPG